MASSSYELLDRGVIYTLGDNRSVSPASDNKQWPSNKAEPALNNSTSSTDPVNALQSSTLDKLFLLAATILPLLVSAFLLAANILNERWTGLLYSFFSHHRIEAQVIVSIFSAFFATLNVYIVTKLLNLATRIHLLRYPLSLNMIKFIESIVKRSFVTSLPGPMFTISLILLLIFEIPHILWIGTLTPVPSNATIVTQVLQIPQYSIDSNSTWSGNGRNWASGCTNVTNAKGVFSDCPVNIIQSNLLSQAAQATSNQTRIHSKNDNSHYSYVGRSYGVGSSAGIIEGNLYNGHNSSNLLSYNYTEPGYLTNVICFHNDSSDFHLEEIEAGQDVDGIPHIYYAIGLFPNAVPGHGQDFFSVVGLDGDSAIVGLAAKRYSNRNIILLTAGSNYAGLNGTQCEAILTPTEFAVNVDVANKLIFVLPLSETNVSFDPTAGLAATLMDQINTLGMESTSLYTSTVGGALMANMAPFIFNDTSHLSPEAFGAMGASFNMILDDLLVFIGSSQFFVPERPDFSTVNAQLIVQAVRLGGPKYAFATFGMCTALLVALIIEAGRTRAWRWLPKWDFTDMISLVFASAVAGKDVVDESWGRGRGQEVWEGDASSGKQDEMLGNVRLMLGKKVVRPDQVRGMGHEEQEVAGHKEHGVELTAVSFCTPSAKNVQSLV